MATLWGPLSRLGLRRGPSADTTGHNTRPSAEPQPLARGSSVRETGADSQRTKSTPRTPASCTPSVASGSSTGGRRQSGRARERGVRGADQTATIGARGRRATVRRHTGRQSQSRDTSVGPLADEITQRRSNRGHQGGPSSPRWVSCGETSDRTVPPGGSQASREWCRQRPMAPKAHTGSGVRRPHE